MKIVKKIFLSPLAVLKKGIEYFWIKKIFSQIVPTTTFQGKVVVFNIVRSIHESFCLELFLAGLFAKNQARSIIILDDGVFSHYDSVQHSENIEMGKLQLKGNMILYLETMILQVFAKYAFSNMVEFITVSSIMRQEGIDIGKIDEYDISSESINIVDIARSSTRRFFQTDVVDESNEMHRKYYKLSERNCKISLITAKHVENKIRPTNFITTHGIYSVWGPAFDYLKKNKAINCVVFGPNAYKKREISFFPEKHQITDKVSDLSVFLKNHLDAKKRDKTIAYFGDRINRKEKDTSVYFKNIVSTDFKIGKNKKIVIAFPNVVWDGDIQERNTVFSGVTDWLIKTIEYARRHPNIHLIIRFHPSEATWYQNTIRLQSIVEKRVDGIHQIENLTLIPSDLFVDTYDLVKNHLDIALVYDGMLALEVAFLGKPVVLCGRGRFTNNDFGVQPLDQDRFYRILDTIDSIKVSWNVVEQRELAIKLCYYYLYHKSYTFPALNNDKNDFGASFMHLKKRDIDIAVNVELRSILQEMLEVENEKQ